MHVIGTCKNEDQIKNEGARVVTKFLPLYVFGDFQDNSAANAVFGARNLPNYELIRDFMSFLLIGKIEENPIKI